MDHPCHAPRDPLKGAALAARQSRFRGALEACMHRRGCDLLCIACHPGEPFP